MRRARALDLMRTRRTMKMIAPWTESSSMRLRSSKSTMESPRLMRWRLPTPSPHSLSLWLSPPAPNSAYPRTNTLLSASRQHSTLRTNTIHRLPFTDGQSRSPRSTLFALPLAGSVAILCRPLNIDGTCGAQSLPTIGHYSLARERTVTAVFSELTKKRPYLPTDLAT